MNLFQSMANGIGIYGALFSQGFTNGVSLLLQIFNDVIRIVRNVSVKPILVYNRLFERN